MFQPLLIIALIIILFLAFLKIKSQKEESIVLKKELADDQKEFSHLSQYNDKLKEIKTQKKNQILELFSKQVKVSNSDVVKSLQISSATAFRYLDELENDGKIAQNGKLGHTVFYSKIK